MRFTSNDNLEEILDRLDNKFLEEIIEFKKKFKTDSQKLSADDIEAYFGYCYLTKGQEVSDALFQKYFISELELFDPTKDYISCLQIFAQKKYKIVPDYLPAIEKMASKNDHEFYIQVKIGNDICGEGTGPNKPKAKKTAAFDALKRLGQVS